jgi:hypothetical protein
MVTYLRKYTIGRSYSLFLVVIKLRHQRLYLQESEAMWWCGWLLKFGSPAAGYGNSPGVA